MTVPRLFMQMTGSQFGGRWGKGVGVALACLMIAASAVTVPRCYALPKQDFTGARDYVERHRSPGDTVVAVGLAGVAYGRYFAPRWSVAQTRSQLNTILRANPIKIWLVYTLPIELKSNRPDIWNVIEKDFEIVKVFPGTLGGGEVYVCQQRPQQEAQSVLLFFVNNN